MDERIRNFFRTITDIDRSIAHLHAAYATEMVELFNGHSRVLKELPAADSSGGCASSLPDIVIDLPCAARHPQPPELNRSL